VILLLCFTAQNCVCSYTYLKFRDLFVSDAVTPEGVYGIKMHMNGGQQTIFVDDFVPCKRNEPFFSHAHGEEIWVILLEKAWAKSHGNYDRIIGGTSSNTMRDLTGAPAYSLKTSQAGLWETILASDQATHCMAAGQYEHPMTYLLSLSRALNKSQPQVPAKRMKEDNLNKTGSNLSGSFSATRTA
jgi:hypothetical protein